jgi:hypothetical protein
MNIIQNDAIIKRNAKIAQLTGFAGLGVLLVGVYFFITRPEQFALIWGIVMVGFIMSQVGIYFTNRWGRRPRPDEHLNIALKGLDNNYTLYHYTTPISHLLVGPAGIWVLLPKYQKGTITYENGRWRQRGGGFFLGYMKIFGQEGLGRPDLEVTAEIESVRRFLEKKLPEQELPPVQAALVFTNESADLAADDASTPTVSTKKLKELIRKSAKNKPITNERVKEIQQAINEDIKEDGKKEDLKKVKG